MVFKHDVYAVCVGNSILLLELYCTIVVFKIIAKTIQPQTVMTFNFNF